MFPRVDERTKHVPGQTLALAAVSHVLSRCTYWPIGLPIIVKRQTTLVKVASVPLLAVHNERCGLSCSRTHYSAGRSLRSLDGRDAPVVGQPIALVTD